MTTPDGTAARFVGFKRHLRPEVVGRDGVFLFSERGVTALTGRWIGWLAGLLDGTRDVRSLLGAQPGGLDEKSVLNSLQRLGDAGLIAERDPRGLDSDETSLAYWDACGLVPTDSEVARTKVELTVITDAIDEAAARVALSEAGLPLATGDPGVSGEPVLSVVLCSDYLDPRLAEIDSAHRAAGRPWLLAKPVGVRVWLGPLFRPGESACWQCLASRLWGHRHAEACVQAWFGRTGPVPRPCPTVPALLSAGMQLVALEILKWLAGHRDPEQSGVWTLDSVNLQAQRHELRRRPQCRACGDPDLMNAQVHRPVTLHSVGKQFAGGASHRSLAPRQVLERYRHLISPVTGIVKDVEPVEHAPPFVNAYRSGLNVAASEGGRIGLRAAIRNQCGGKGTNATEAKVGALCEALERYSGQFQGDEPRIRESFRSLGERAIHPNECMLYDERQYEVRAEWNAAHSSCQHVPEPLDEDAVLEWTPVWSLRQKRHRLFPTAMLYYGAPDQTGLRYVRSNSNGNAAGSSLEDAVLQGLLELVERDAVALWWYNRTRVAKVDLGAFRDSWIEEQQRGYASLGRDLWVLDLTSDLRIPVMAALSRSADGANEQIMLGFGAHLDPRIALRRALSEHDQLLPSVLRPDFCARASSDDPDLARWLSEATLANQPYLAPDPIVRPRVMADFEHAIRMDLRGDIDAIVDLLAAKGMDTYVLDQTRPDVGLPVVKVIVPGLRHFWARFAAGRLFDVPVRMGLLDRPTRYADLNPLPMFL